MIPTIEVEIGTTLAEAEKQLILATLDRYPDKKEVARVLGISMPTLLRRLRAYGWWVPKRSQRPLGGWARRRLLKRQVS